MADNDEFARVDVEQIGLDRADINWRGQIEFPEHDSQEDRHKRVHFKDETGPRSSSNRVVDSIKQKKHNAGVKVRKKLHMTKTTDEMTSSTSPVLANTNDQKSESRLDGKDTSPEKHTLRDIIHNPVETFKDKTSNKSSQEMAGNIAAKEIPHGQDVDLVKASSAVDRARSEHEKMLAVQNLDELLKLRQSTYVRWTMDRHVTKIRVLPRDKVVKKSRTDFETKTGEGKPALDWRSYGRHLVDYYAHRYGGQYIGYGSQPPTPSRETILPNVERLIVATSPFQEFIMTTRRVYRWEHPVETTKYLLIYATLWYFNLILPGILSWVIYIVAERRINGITMKALREDIKHRENVHVTALSLNEFIEKKGEENWVDEILQDLGPWLMVQLSDLANFFESIRNFYEWRKPYRTSAALMIIGLAIVTVICTPQWVLVKSFFFSVGFTFFAIWPISVNFPEYRLLVSPTKRFLWNIPTHGEWAIKYIQAEGTRVRISATTSAPDAGPVVTADLRTPAKEDYGFYVAHHNHMPGHLVISKSTVRFVSKRPHSVHFEIAYDDMQSLEKRNRIVKRNVPDTLLRDRGLDVVIWDHEGKEVVLKDVDRRDEAFSQMVGFSDHTWQIVW